MGKPSHREESHTELMFKGKSSETSPAMQSLQEKSHLKRYCLLFSVWDVKIGHFLWKCPAKGENVFPPISIYIHNLAELMQVDALLYITGSMWWYRLWLRLSQTQRLSHSSIQVIISVSWSKYAPATGKWTLNERFHLQTCCSSMNIHCISFWNFTFSYQITLFNHLN